jgi:hypothetical protein
VEPGGDWAVLYNTDTTAANDGSYSMLCKPDPSAETAAPTAAPATTGPAKAKFIIECSANNDGGCSALETKWNGCKAQSAQKKCTVKITTENYGTFNVVGDLQEG